MRDLYLLCFALGTGFTAINFLLGELFSSFGADFDVSMPGDIDVDADFGDGISVSPLKPILIAVFLAVFGGSGLIFEGQMPEITALFSAALLAFLATYPLYKLISYLAGRYHHSAVIAQGGIVGLDASITEIIPAGGFGKISYHAKGNSFSSPARGEDGVAFSLREQVVIARIEGNVFYVKRKEETRDSDLLLQE